MSVLSKKHEKQPGVVVFDFVVKRSVEPRESKELENPRSSNWKAAETDRKNSEDKPSDIAT
jgi:hypothetical protein